MAIQISGKENELESLFGKLEELEARIQAKQSGIAKRRSDLAEAGLDEKGIQKTIDEIRQERHKLEDLQITFTAISQRIEALRRDIKVARQEQAAVMLQEIKTRHHDALRETILALEALWESSLELERIRGEEAAICLENQIEYHSHLIYVVAIGDVTLNQFADLTLTKLEKSSPEIFANTDFRTRDERRELRPAFERR